MSRRAIIPPAMRGYYDDWRMAPGIACGGFLFLTGFNGMGPDGAISADPATQFRATFEQIGMVLAETGLGFESIVEMTSYHVGLRDHVELFKTVRADYVREPYPAWTAVGVAELIATGAIVEVRVIAQHPDAGPAGDSQIT